jgi:hypothetical protein
LPKDRTEVGMPVSRVAIASTPDEAMDSYRDELAAWDRLERD